MWIATRTPIDYIEVCKGVSALPSVPQVVSPGTERSKAYGDTISDWAGRWHERGAFNPESEKRMDLNNNMCGRYAAGDDREAGCKRLLRDGMLTTINPPHDGFGTYGR